LFLANAPCDFLDDQQFDFLGDQQLTQEAMCRR